MNLSPPKGTLWGKVQPFWCFLCQTLAEFHPPHLDEMSTLFLNPSLRKKNFFIFVFLFFPERGIQKESCYSLQKGVGHILC